MKAYILILVFFIVNTKFIAQNEIKIFQPNIISIKGQHDDYISFNPDETLLTLTRFTDNYRQGTIYISKKLDESWQEPTIATFSGKFNDSRAMFSPDGKRIYFASNRPTKERPNKRDLDIWYVEMKDGNWSKPYHTGNLINSEINETHPSIAENGNIYFARWGRSTNDIYMSKYKDGYFKKPIALKTINTNHPESHPFIDPKERFLLFGSTRDASRQNGDIYISIKNKDKWSVPSKLDIINSNLYDYSAKINSKENKIYFSRANFRENGEKADIYFLDLNWSNIYQKYLNNASFEVEQKIIENEALPLVFNNQWPIIKDVYVNNEGPFSFLLDMGASGLGRIDKSLYKKLKLKISGTRRNTDGAGNTWTQKTVNVNNIRLGSIHFTNQNLQMRDYWEDVGSGILGKDFFFDRLLTIDYKNKQIKLSGKRLNPNDKGVMPYNRAFIIKGYVSEMPCDFSIDTGSQLNFHFPKSFLEKNKISFKNTGKTNILKRSGGESTGYEAKIEGDISIGGIKLVNPIIWYSDLQNPNRINVGSKTLKNYSLTIDQQNKLIQIVE